MKRVEDNLGSIGNAKVLFYAPGVGSFAIMLSNFFSYFLLFTVSCSAQLSNGASEYLQSSISKPTACRGGNGFHFIWSYLCKCSEALVSTLWTTLMKGSSLLLGQ